MDAWLRRRVPATVPPVIDDSRHLRPPLTRVRSFPLTPPSRRAHGGAPASAAAAKRARLLVVDVDPFDAVDAADRVDNRQRSSGSPVGGSHPRHGQARRSRRPPHRGHADIRGPASRNHNRALALTTRADGRKIRALRAAAPRRTEVARVLADGGERALPRLAVACVYMARVICDRRRPSPAATHASSATEMPVNGVNLDTWRSRIQARARASADNSDAPEMDDQRSSVAAPTGRSPSAYSEHPLLHQETSPRRCPGARRRRASSEFLASFWRVGARATEPKVRGSNPLGRATRTRS
jgi:hypothetical protein